MPRRRAAWLSPFRLVVSTISDSGGEDMTRSDSSSCDHSLAEQAAMLVQGDEVYGIGTIIKLYAQSLPAIAFIAMGEGHMVDWLKRNGNRVDVVPGLVRFHEGGPSLGVLSRVPGAFLQARRDAAKIDEILRSRGIRIVHTQWRPQQITAGFLRQRGYRSVWQINNNMSPGRLFGVGRQLNHRFARWGADLLLPASDFIAGFWAGARVPMATIRNAAVPVFSAPNVLPERPVRCLIAGRLVPLKGHHTAVDAVIRARKTGIDVRLDLFGDPVEGNPYVDELKRKVVEAGAEAAIRFLGFRADMRQSHQAYHLGLQCRVDPEPCSLWVCETLVDGLPLIASATGGTPELVEDGVTGLLYQSGNTDELATKLAELAADPGRLQAMRAAAFERGRKHFSLDRFATDTVRAYRAHLNLNSASSVEQPA